MHLAAAFSALRSLDFLLRLPGADIDVIDGRMRTPLMHAVAAHSTASIVWLARHGAKMSLRDEDGLTAVHFAADAGFTSDVALLGNLGADLEALDEKGRMPLELAAGSGKLEVVEYLVLTCRSSAAAETAALAAVKADAVGFWIARCLKSHVGCHDIAPGETFLCGAIAGGLSLPSVARCHFSKHFPEQLITEPRIVSISSGVLGLLVAPILLIYPAPHQGPAAVVARQVLSLIGFLFTAAGSTCWCRAANTHPGRIDSQPNSLDKLRQEYEAALTRVAAITAEDSDESREHWLWPWGLTTPLIHQMSIVAPERSKYCTATRQCVPLYDHYCTFLRNPVGRDNYPMFMATIGFSTVACVSLVAAGVILIFSQDAVAILLGSVTAMYFGIFVLLWALLSMSHYIQAYLGETTYETIQKNRGTLKYWVDDTGVYVNPDKGACMRNFCRRLFPAGAA